MHRGFPSRSKTSARPERPRTGLTAAGLALMTTLVACSNDRVVPPAFAEEKIADSAPITALAMLAQPATLAPAPAAAPDDVTDRCDGASISPSVPDEGVARSLDGPRDVDWYRIDVEPGREYVIYTRGPTNTTCELYSSCGEHDIAFALSDAPRGAARRLARAPNCGFVAVRPTEPGKFFLKIFSSSRASGPYTPYVKATPL